MQVDEQRVIQIGPGATPEVIAAAEREAAASGARVVVSSQPAPQAPSSPSTSPAEALARSAGQRATCSHTERTKLHQMAMQGSTTLFVTYCSACGALGPAANGRTPSLTRWQFPG